MAFTSHLLDHNLSTFTLTYLSVRTLISIYVSVYIPEYMGMIYGQYDAKEGTKGGQGFVPGGSSLHSCM